MHACVTEDDLSKKGLKPDHRSTVIRPDLGTKLGLKKKALKRACPLRVFEVDVGEKYDLRKKG